MSRLLAFGLLLLLPACGPSFPKDSIEESVRKLFQKELKSDVETQLVGKTLYVSFQLDNLVSKNFDLPKDAIEKLEDGMLSISRIALSTDADIEYTVIEARDRDWSVQTRLIRKMRDLKDLFYWRISKPDFDERLVLETRRADSPAGSPSRADWTDIDVSDYMGRWVASRINLGARTNPFLGVLLNIERVDPRYDEASRTLELTAISYGHWSSTATSSLTLEFFKDSIEEQMALAEKKYMRGPSADQGPKGGWAERVVVKDGRGTRLFELHRADWEPLIDGGNPKGGKRARVHIERG